MFFLFVFLLYVYQGGTTDSQSAPYFPGVTFPPDQRVREKRKTLAGKENPLEEWEESRLGEEEGEGEGEEKIRVKRRGVGGLGGQKYGGAFVGEKTFC